MEKPSQQLDNQPPSELSLEQLHAQLRAVLAMFERVENAQTDSGQSNSQTRAA